MSTTTCGSDVAANSLFSNLVNVSEFDIPAVDLTSADYQIPDLTTDPLFADIIKLELDDLTTGQPRGEGMFDKLMESNKAHLHEEYSAGRLTAAAYSEAYVAMTSAVMSASLQYLLQKDQAYYQAALVQKQAQVAQIGVIQAKVQLEETKARLIEQQLSAKTRAAAYALTKVQIAAEDARRCLTQAQESQVNYETGTMMPKQVEKLTADIALSTAEELRVDSQTAQIGAQTAQITYQTANILPEQLANLVAEKNQKTYQTENLLPAQTANVTKDTETKDYTLSFLLPSQLDLSRENVEAARAKTLDTRTDGTTIVTGSIGKQKELHAQQIESYKRDAEWKVGKGLIDTWITGKSMDENYGTPNAFTMGQIDATISSIKTNLGI